MAKINGMILKTLCGWYIVCDLESKEGGMCGKCAVQKFCHGSALIRMTTLCREAFTTNSGRFRKMTRADVGKTGAFDSSLPKKVFMRARGGRWVVMKRHKGGAPHGCEGCRLQDECRPGDPLSRLCGDLRWPSGGFPAAGYDDVVSAMEGLL